MGDGQASHHGLVICTNSYTKGVIVGLLLSDG
jgi:hypothetical protein